MGGAVPGMGFYIGGIVAPIVAGLMLGCYERYRFPPKPSWGSRVWKNLVGIGLTALFWVAIVHFDSVAAGRWAMEILAKLWVFMIWMSILPWLLFGIAARITAREAGSDRL